MTWDTTPWFVEGGRHSADVARLVAYAATGGKDGVITPGALKVRQATVPGQLVVLDPGSVTIVNRKAGAIAQSYLARKIEAENVVLTPTSGAPRTDLIVAMIEDPQYPPTAPGVTEFVRTRVIEGVSSSTRRLQQVPTYETAAGYAIARVTRPANTGTVTNAHITDLRELAQPRSERQLLTYALGTSDTETQTNTAVTGEVWPNDAQWRIPVPLWATRVKISAFWNGVRIPAGNAVGSIWVRLGELSDADAPRTELVRYDTPGSSQTARETWGVSDDIVVPTSLRGTEVLAHLRARLESASSNAARPIVDNGSSVVLDLQFVEEVE